MKNKVKPKDLTNIIKMLFFVFFGSLLVYAIKGLFAYMENDASYLNEYSTDGTVSKITMLIFFIKLASKTVFFVGGFYLIKILNFEKLQELFSDQKINLFKKSGKLFILSGIIGTGTFWIDMYQDKFASLKVNNDFLSILYFSAIIGLFLIVFSLILEKAKKLKQENDLTI